MARWRKPKEKKPKVPRLEVVMREGGTKDKPGDKDMLAIEAYKEMDGLIERWHTHLAGARMVIAWMRGLKANADDLLLLGKAIKASDLPRQLGEYDWCIAINREAFGMFTPAQRRALIDHELCHCQVAKDKHGEVKTDALGRTVFRTRKHDVEEFREIVHRHGLYKSNLHEFWQSVIESEKAPLLAGAKKTKPPAAQPPRQATA